MKTNKTLLSLAVLAATTTSPVAVASLSFEYDVAADGWCQLLPAGHFKAVDGRPRDVPSGQWFINATIAERMISDAKNRVNDLLIDYEHQSLNAESNGKPAPAAGWITDIEWREGSGLWIKPKWTARAAEFIKNDEYRFLSAVFPYNTETGEPLGLHSAGLVNRPGIDGMASVEALSALFNQPQQENPAMNKAMRDLLAILGIQLKDGEQLTEEQGATALTALTELQTKAGEVDGLKTEVASLKETGSNPDPAKFVPIAALTELQTQVAALSAKAGAGELDSLVKDALEDGRLLPAMEEWARKLGGQDMAALKSYLDNAAPLAALKSMQSGDTDTPEENQGTAVLTADEKEAARLMGKSEEEYAKIKTAQA